MLLARIRWFRSEIDFQTLEKDRMIVWQKSLSSFVESERFCEFNSIEAGCSTWKTKRKGGNLGMVTVFGVVGDQMIVIFTPSRSALDQRRASQSIWKSLIRSI